MPPLAADGHRRDPAWRDGLALLLDSFDDSAMPPQVQAVVARLRARDADAIETLADEFLHGDVDAADAGAVLYVAAALQVYFTRHGREPACIGAAIVAAARAVPVLRIDADRRAGDGDRADAGRALSLLFAVRRPRGITSARSASPAASHAPISLEGIEGDAGIVKAETCDDCHTYAKMIYQAQDMKADPFADDLASLGLDVLVAEAGWSRHAPNPLLLVGG